jgi:hypothetical protein
MPLPPSREHRAVVLEANPAHCRWGPRRARERGRDRHYAYDCGDVAKSAQDAEHSTIDAKLGLAGWNDTTSGLNGTWASRGRRNA